MLLLNLAMSLPLVYFVRSKGDVVDLCTLLELWGGAILTANKIPNIIPHKHINKIPYKLWGSPTFLQESDFGAVWLR